MLIKPMVAVIVASLLIFCIYMLFRAIARKNIHDVDVFDAGNSGVENLKSAINQLMSLMNNVCSKSEINSAGSIGAIHADLKALLTVVGSDTSFNDDIAAVLILTNDLIEKRFMASKYAATTDTAAVNKSNIENAIRKASEVLRSLLDTQLAGSISDVNQMISELSQYNSECNYTEEYERSN